MRYKIEKICRINQEGKKNEVETASCDVTRYFARGTSLSLDVASGAKS